jgi:murein DD-endopeptidase MepM/ murein hydrolase activator NlpD
MSRGRWRSLLGVLVAIIVLWGASSPSISQRVPRYFFPALAIVGAALAVLAWGRVVASSVRRYRTEQRLPIGALVLNGVAVVLFVALPLARLLGLVTAPASGPPRILAGFGDWLGGEGYPRLSAHRGIDVAGRPGAAVLAAAGGRVSVARDNGDLCGLIVAIVHEPHDYRTVYCHLSELAVQRGDRVARGQRIGALGTTGQRPFPGYEHVHLELQRGGNSSDLEDPVSRLAGCFDPRRTYPLDRLVLTYPVRC